MNQTKRVMVSLVISGAMTMAALPVVAATPQEQPKAELKSIDIDQDGNVSQDEYMALGGTEDSFRKSDVNSDNKLDKEELTNTTMPAPMKAKKP